MESGAPACSRLAAPEDGQCHQELSPCLAGARPILIRRNRPFAPFPSPRPSPSGRGRIAGSVSGNLAPQEYSADGVRGSLSPRERAGVRGNRATELSLPAKTPLARFRPSLKS